MVETHRHRVSLSALPCSVPSRLGSSRRVSQPKHTKSERRPPYRSGRSPDWLKCAGSEARRGGRMGEVTLRTICRRGHVKEPSGRCKECERLTYERRVAARRAEGLT